MSGEQIEDVVFLTQTDTTIGFVSQNRERLDSIKQRPSHKYYIKALPSLEKLKEFTRVPNTHKNRVRRAKRSTFIFPNGHSYRIIRDKKHLKLISKLGWAYTTSANLSNESYDKKFAISKADEIVGSLQSERGMPSQIYKINNYSIKKIR